MPSRRGFLAEVVVDRGITYAGISSPGGPGLGGLYRSDDGGGTWRQLAPDAFVFGVEDVEVLRDGTIVVAAPANPSSVLVSRDGGTTWQSVVDAS